MLMQHRDHKAASPNAAQACLWCSLDDEDELVSDEERTCLNCRYRRWSAQSFECLKQPEKFSGPA